MNSLTHTANQNDSPTVNEKISGMGDVSGGRNRNSILSKATTSISKCMLPWTGGGHADAYEFVYNFLFTYAPKALDYIKYYITAVGKEL